MIFIMEYPHLSSFLASLNQSPLGEETARYKRVREKRGELERAMDMERAEKTLRAV